MVRGIKKKRTFRFHYRDAGLLVIGQRSSVPDPIVQLQVRPRLWRPRPSLAKCLFIRKKLPFFSSSSPSLPLPFSSSDREKEGVDGGREIARTRRTRPRHERAHWKGADAVNLIQVLIGHGNRETTNEERGGIEGNKEKRGRRKERKKKRLPLGGPLSPGGWP